jgi:hypothetical protein|tara:strand:+ start:1140 stop:1307 length:168 start_codon:yes stop_codon:yes gene_type:complete
MERVNFKTHQDIPDYIADWVMSVSNVTNIWSLDLEDINSLVNGYEEWINESKDVA